MSTRMLSPSHPVSTKLPTPKHFKSRFSAVCFAACLHKSAFSFGKTLYAQMCFFHVYKPYLRNTSKRMGWSLRSSVDGSGLNPASPINKSRSGTRLIRALQSFQIKVNERIKAIRKDFPTKLLFFLVGFYCSTALATIIGQTGDWDILAAALAMAVVEGIGLLTYKASLPLFDKARNLISMFNYWKAGLSLGLFLDSFKYELDNIFPLWNPFTFELDFFAIFGCIRFIAVSLKYWVVRYTLTANLPTQSCPQAL